MNVRKEHSWLIPKQIVFQPMECRINARWCSHLIVMREFVSTENLKGHSCGSICSGPSVLPDRRSVRCQTERNTPVHQIGCWVRCIVTSTVKICWIFIKSHMRRPRKILREDGIDGACVESEQSWIPLPRTEKGQDLENYTIIMNQALKITSHYFDSSYDTKRLAFLGITEIALLATRISDCMLHICSYKETWVQGVKQNLWLMSWSASWILSH
jgi:hypothetical protein